MIEILYDKQENTEDNIFAGITLPKNIRQIGMPTGNRRIYIEDYVMTYLKQLANPNSTFARGAILVGEVQRNGQADVIYVSGALAAQNLELDLEESTFDGETWSFIYQEVKTYFPDLEVVGWFLSRMGFSTSVKGEDAFYLMDEEGLRRQSGYYIYYARNEAMQNFMIESKGETEPERQSAVEQKDEAVLRNYKKIMEERARSVRIERMNRRLQAVCAFLAIAVLALGIAVFSNYQMLEKVELALAENGVEVFAQEQQTETGMKRSETSTGKEKASTEKTTTDVKTAAANLPRYYTVQSGDTLSSISFKMYNSVGYVAELMEANGLGEADDIHEGDQIIIPTVKK